MPKPIKVVIVILLIVAVGLVGEFALATIGQQREEATLTHIMHTEMQIGMTQGQVEQALDTHKIRHTYNADEARLDGFVGRTYWTPFGSGYTIVNLYFDANGGLLNRSILVKYSGWH